MDDYIYILAILGGFLAGVINTLAGSGSLITLPILIFLGLPAYVANGTNRLGVVLQTIVSVFTLYKRGNLELKGSVWLIVPAILGAIPGAYIAVDLSDQVLKNIIGAVMIIMLIPLIMNADKWLRESSEEGGRHKRWHVVATFVLIGAYGGFLQAGVGIMLLSGMVLLAGFTIRRANGLKNLIVL
ncbi:MAG TPA: sulfite exporter TauE/SafE family protein, partial [Flavobacteriales bacterium]|nr:sulfite exporter TauE/SafE family protein [Flavobacteriales bacterium]